MLSVRLRRIRRALLPLICLTAAITGLHAQQDVVFIGDQNGNGTASPLHVWETGQGSPLHANLPANFLQQRGRGIAARYGTGIYAGQVLVFHATTYGGAFIRQYTPGSGTFIDIANFGFTAPIHQIALNWECTRLYLGMDHGAVFTKIEEWDVSTPTSPVLLRTITVPGIETMSLSPDGKRIVGAYAQGGTSIVDIDLTTTAATVSTVSLTATDEIRGDIRIEPTAGLWAYFPIIDQANGNARKIGRLNLATYPATLGTNVNLQSLLGGDLFAPAGIAFDTLTDRVYFSTHPAGATASSLLVFLPSAQSGGGSPSFVQLPAVQATYGIEFSPGTGQLYMTYGSNGYFFKTYTVDTNTNIAADVGGGTLPALGYAYPSIAIAVNKPAKLTVKAVPAPDPLITVNTGPPVNTTDVYLNAGLQASLGVPGTTQPVPLSTSGPKYDFLKWVKAPEGCPGGAAFATGPVAITDPLAIDAENTYCACFEKQWYVTVNVTGSCTAALNGTTVASGSGIWVKEGTTVTGTATPSTGATVTAPVVANSAGQSINIVCGTGSTGGTGNCTPPPQGLTAWYPFDEATGPSVSQIATAPNLNWVSGPTAVPVGKVAGAIGLNGTQYLQAANNTAFNPGANSFSVDFWMRSTTPGRVILDKVCGGIFGGTGCQPSTFQGWRVELTPAGRLSFNIGTVSPVTTGGLMSNTSMPVLTDGNWHFVGIVWDRATNNITVYIDGTSAAKTFTIPFGAPAGSQITSNLPLRVGADALGTASTLFNGAIDELEIFDGVTPASTFQAIYDADAAGKCKNAGPCATASSHSALRAWWSFEGTDPILNDKRGVNNFLIPRNATRTTGYVGQAMQFGTVPLNSNNSASTTDAAPEINFNSESFTIDAWIKYESGVNGFRSIVDKFGGDVNNGGGYSFFMDNGALMLSITPVNTSGVNARVWSSNTVNVADNNWHHVAVVVDRTKNDPDFYVDGVLRALTSSSGPMYGPSINLQSIMPLNVGGFNFAGSNTRGLIDELQIFAEAVPASVIKEIYDAKTTGKCPRDDKGCVLAPFGMVSWYPFTPVSGQTYFNDHATTNSTLVPVGVVPPVSSQVGTGVLMTHNTVGYLQTTASFPEHNFGTAPFSLDFWVRAGAANQTRYVAEKMAYSGSNPLQGWSVRILNGKLLLVIADGTGNTATYTSSLNAITTGATRRHIAITANRLGAPQMYFDGLPDTGITASGSATVMLGNLNNTSVLRVGASTVSTPPPADAIEMELDELQIFSRALFAGEVYAIFASPQGKCAQTPGAPVIINPPPTNVTVTVNLSGCAAGTSFTSNPAAVGNVITVAQGGTVTITFTGAIGSVVATPGGPIPLTGNTATLTNVQANTVLTITCAQITLCYPINMGGMVAWYPLNETGTGGGVTHTDIAGINDVLARQGAVTPTTGKVNGAQLFTNGANAFTVSASPELDFGPGDFSADAWINPQSPSGVIMGKLLGQGWYINLRSTGGPSELELGIAVPGFLYQWATQGANIPLNTWTHIAVVARRNAPPEFYINGALFPTTVILAGGSAAVPPVNVNTSGPFRLSGTIPIGGTVLPPFSGALDEVELFNRSLQGAEILGIYQAGPMGKCVPAGAPVTVNTNLNPVQGVTVGLLSAGSAVDVYTNPNAPTGNQTVFAPQKKVDNFNANIEWNLKNWSVNSVPNLSYTLPNQPVPIPSSGGTYTANYDPWYKLNVVVIGNCVSSLSTGYYPASPNPIVSVTGAANPIISYQGPPPGGGGALPAIDSVANNSAVPIFFPGGTLTVNCNTSTSVTVTVNTNPANIGVTVGVAGQTALNSVTASVAGSSAQTVTATPSSTIANGTLYNFTGWSPSGPNVTAPASGSATYTANYNVGGYVVTATGCGVSVGPSALALQQNPLVFPPNATLTVTANPTATQVFQNILVSIGGNITTLTTNPATFTLTGPATITGNCLSSQVVNGTFDTLPVALFLRVGPTGDFTLAPITRQINTGQELQVATQAQQTRNGTGYQFIGWSNGATAPVTSITPTSAVNLTASFRVACYVVTASVNPSSGGTIAASARGLTGFADGCYAPGTVLTLSVTPATGQAVTSWTGVTATGNTATYTVNAPATIVANVGAAAAPVLVYEYVGRSGLTINMRARNTGNAAASAVRVTAVTVQNTGELFRYTPNTPLPLTVGDIAPGGTASFALGFLASGGAVPTGAFNFSVTASAANAAAATTVIQVPAVAGTPVLTLDAISRVNNGANATLTFRFTNTGTATATNIVAMVSIQATAGTVTVNAPSTAVADIAAGASRDVTFIVSGSPGATIANGSFNAQIFVSSNAGSVSKAWHFAAPTTINPL